MFNNLRTRTWLEAVNYSLSQNKALLFTYLIFFMLYEPPHKTNNLHMRKQRSRSAVQFTAQLISIFVFAIQIVQSVFLNPKFRASSLLLRLYRLVSVRPVGNQIVVFLMQRLIFLFIPHTSHPETTNVIEITPFVV